MPRRTSASEPGHARHLTRSSSARRWTSSSPPSADAATASATSSRAIEEEQATLEAELAAFNADYLREVVTVLAELHDIEARIAALVAKRSGAPRTRRPPGGRARSRETTTRLQAIPRPPGPLPTGDLKKLFRDAAKRMHPDLAPDDDGRQHAEAFMKRLNQAFAARDEEAIVNLVRQWEAASAGERGRRTRAPPAGSPRSPPRSTAPVRGSRRSAAPSSPR